MERISWKVKLYDSKAYQKIRTKVSTSISREQPGPGNQFLTAEKFWMKWIFLYHYQAFISLAQNLKEKTPQYSHTHTQ